VVVTRVDVTMASVGVAAVTAAVLLAVTTTMTTAHVVARATVTVLLVAGVVAVTMTADTTALAVPLVVGLALAVVRPAVATTEGVVAGTKERDAEFLPFKLNLVFFVCFRDQFLPRVGSGLLACTCLPPYIGRLTYQRLVPLCGHGMKSITTFTFPFAFFLF